MPAALNDFTQIIAYDFEFRAKDGNPPEPLCVVWKELISQETKRLWLLENAVRCPFPQGHHVLFLAYYSSAEIGCHLALGWPVPKNIVDLFVEFRC